MFLDTNLNSNNMEEITAGDIMLNNWFHVNGYPMYIDAIYSDMVSLDFKGNEGGSWEEYTKDLVPIPLTEDVLLKCGFEKLPHMTVTNSMMLDIGRGRQISIGDIDNCNQMMWLQSIAGKKVTDLICLHNYDYDGWLYVHKLQNIVKSLTGNELKIEV